jgi:hypothetical protein
LYKPGWARQRHGWFLVVPSRILLVAGREGMFGCQIFIRHILVLPVLLILVQYVLNRVAVELEFFRQADVMRTSRGDSGDTFPSKSTIAIVGRRRDWGNPCINWA